MLLYILVTIEDKLNWISMEISLPFKFLNYVNCIVLIAIDNADF